MKTTPGRPFTQGRLRRRVSAGTLVRLNDDDSMPGKVCRVKYRVHTILSVFSPRWPLYGFESDTYSLTPLDGSHNWILRARRDFTVHATGKVSKMKAEKHRSGLVCGVFQSCVSDAVG